MEHSLRPDDRRRELEEAEILLRVREGKKRDFRLLVDAYGKEVHGLCYRVLGSEAGAREATLAACKDAYRSALDERDRTPLALKFKRSALRVALRMADKGLSESSFDPSLNAFRKAVLRLRRHREALALCLFERLSPELAAGVLQLPEAVVVRKVNEGLLRLSRELPSWSNAPGGGRV